MIVVSVLALIVRLIQVKVEQKYNLMIFIKSNVGNPTWMGDNYCDRNFNNAGCFWDYGDCCEKKPSEHGWDHYCNLHPELCQCLDPNYNE